MQYPSSCAQIRGQCAHGRICVSGCGNGSVVQICLYAAGGQGDIFRLRITAPGVCLTLPELPVCGHVGKLTYLEGRLPDPLIDGARIQVFSSCGSEIAHGVFARSCSCNPCHDTYPPFAYASEPSSGCSLYPPCSPACPPGCQRPSACPSVCSACFPTPPLYPPACDRRPHRSAPCPSRHGCNLTSAVPPGCSGLKRY